MDAKEAEKILGTNYPSSFWDGKTPEVVYTIQCKAKGYLEALNGPEVSLLVEALESIYNDSWRLNSKPAFQVAQEALAKHKDAVK